MKTIVNSNNAPSPIGPYNQGVLVNGVLYASGQIAINPKTNELVLNTIQDETHQVMQNIKEVLNEAGLTFKNIVKCTIFTKDLSQFNEINTVYGSYFENDFPARETVEVAGLPKDVNVEISFIATKEI